MTHDTSSGKRDNMSETQAVLKAAFNIQNADGTYRYSDADLRYFMVYVLLSSGADLSAAPTEVHVMVGEVAEQAGVTMDHKPEEIRAIMKRHFEAHPVNADLREEVEIGLVELQRTQGDIGLFTVFEAFTAVGRDN